MPCLPAAGLRLAKNDPAGAESDFRIWTHICTVEAIALSINGRHREAIALLDARLRELPAPNLFDLRADSERALGNGQAAEADYARVIAPSPPGAPPAFGNAKLLQAECRYKRGHLRRWRGDLAGAVEDFRAAYADLGNGVPGNRGRAAVWLFLVQTEMDQKASALKELDATDRSGWGKPEMLVTRVFLGQINGAEMVRDIGFQGPDANFISSFYSALNHRISGDEKGAIERFRRALAARAQEYDFEFELEEARRQVKMAGLALP